MTQRRLLRIGLVVLIATTASVVVVGVAPAVASGATLYVSTTGHDTSNCQTQSSPCATIPYAVSQAPSVSTINVGAGTFTGQVVIPSGLTSMTIHGNGRSSTSVDGAGLGTVLSMSGSVALTVEDLTIQDGAAQDGGGIESLGGTLTLTDDTVSGNTATIEGGGVYLNSVATLTNVIVSGNTINNTPYPFGSEGAGIYVAGGTVSIMASTFSGNTANSSSSSLGVGGGLATVGGSTTVTDSSISGNTAAWGGGSFNQATVTLTDSTVSGNNATDGAGFYNDGTATVTDDTISGNSATNGGGVLNNAGGVTLIHDTISGNSATGSHGAGGILGSGGITVMATIVAGNIVGGDCDPIYTTTADVGYNLDSQGNCGFSSANHSQSGVDPGLVALGSYGGPTQTQPPQHGNSPAVDQIPPGATGNGTTLCPGADQRGVAAPQGPNCDVGATEFGLEAQPHSFQTPADMALSVPAASGVLAGVTDADPGATSAFSAAVVTSPSHGTVSVNADGSFLYTPDAGYNGPDSFTATATDSYGLVSAPAVISIGVGFFIVTSSIPAATRGSAYSATFQATGGTTPYKWKKKGSLPKGLKLNKTTGVLAGTPSATDKAKSYSFTVRVTDRSSPHQIASKTFTLSLS